MKRIFRFLLIPLCLLVGMAACQHATMAPASRFVLLDGSIQSMDELRGKVTLITFWATSCSTCVAEMPLLAQTQQQYQSRGYHTLAVAMQYDNPVYVKNFARSRQLPFAVAIDHDGQLAQNWGPVRATPTSFLVNRRGQIVQRHVGLLDASNLHSSIENLLSETAS